MSSTDSHCAAGSTRGSARKSLADPHHWTPSQTPACTPRSCTRRVPAPRGTWRHWIPQPAEKKNACFVDSRQNPDLAENSWRVVLTWLVHPRDLDAHATRHQSPGGPTWNDPGSSRTHLDWRNTKMQNNWHSWGQLSAELDLDNKIGNGVPETVTFYNLDTCWYDCRFVFRVWDYCSLDTALTEVSGAVVRLYNSAGLHSTYHINQHGVQHRGSNLNQYGYEELQRRWDVFQLDTSDQSRVVVTECEEGVCPEDNTDPRANHAFC